MENMKAELQARLVKQKKSQKKVRFDIPQTAPVYPESRTCCSTLKPTTLALTAVAL